MNVERVDVPYHHQKKYRTRRRSRLQRLRAPLISHQSLLVCVVNPSVRAPSPRVIRSFSHTVPPHLSLHSFGQVKPFLFTVTRVACFHTFTTRMRKKTRTSSKVYASELKRMRARVFDSRLSLGGGDHGSLRAKTTAAQGGRLVYTIHTHTHTRSHARVMSTPFTRTRKAAATRPFHSSLAPFFFPAHNTRVFTSEIFHQAAQVRLQKRLHVRVSVRARRGAEPSIHTTPFRSTRLNSRLE